jgi:regulator of sirC expression with transglutaminase-like and TPR domain
MLRIASRHAWYVLPEMARAELTLFAHVADRPDAEIDLASAALLIAEDAYPGLDVAASRQELDALGEQAQQRLADMTKPGDALGAVEAKLRRVLELLYRELGFRGNEGDYYDPRNSYLNEVLARRTGIPITLAVVLLEVLRRAGIEASGVGFPGHFLVRAAGPRGPIFVDPFSGEILTRQTMRALHERVSGEARDPDPRLLEPIGARAILVRMLNNLRGIFLSRGDRLRLRQTLERLMVLAPSPELSTELATLGGDPPPSYSKPRIVN